MSQILYSILLIIGLVLTYFSYTAFKKTQHLVNNGIVVESTVIDLIPSYGRKSTTYKPVFEFYDLSNNKRTFTSDISSSPPPFKVGERATLIYNPSDDTSVKVVGFWGLYRKSIILLAIASPLLVIGGAYVLYTLNSPLKWS